MSGTSFTSPLAALLAISTGLLLTGCLPATDDPIAPRIRTVMVTEVNDGDSFIAGDGLEVRLNGVNAPELDECTGLDAARRLEDLLLNEMVEIRGAERDQFGRILGTVLIEAMEVNEQMVSEGLAIATSGSDYVTVEEEARLANRGMWSPSACEATGPLPALEFEAVDFDPAGHDDMEAAHIVSREVAPLSLRSYVLRDESSVNRFVFPEATIPGGGRLKIITGCGTGDATTLYWCSPQPVWNNSGDAALLLDGNGRVVAFHRYPKP